MKKLLISLVTLGIGVSSVFAAYQPSMTEQKVVEVAGTTLLQIVETKHNGNNELLLGILKSFQNKVAGDERKTWILDTLITMTMDAMGMMMDNKMMDDKMMGITKTFDVSGVNFAFSQETITVNKGDTVTINFVSNDGFHDWVVDEFDAATAKVKPADGTTSVTFVADTAGSFEYYCSVGSHREQGMIGTLVVKDADSMMMDDSHSDNMMDDDMMAGLVMLENVVGAQTIRGVSFDGSEAGSARNTTKAEGNHIYAVFENLPDAGADNFYEGWIVRMNGGLSVLSTGELEMKDGKYVNDWSTTQNIDDHTFYVLTLEPNDNDPAPADHIVEAHVR